MARITVRLTSRAASNEIVGFRGDVLAVRVSSPPVDGAANEALVRLLSKALHVPRGDVLIVGGQTSRTKTVEVKGIDDLLLGGRLSRYLEM